MADEYILKQKIFDALEKVAGFFPYKIPGNADTYDKYNEARNDAIGRAEMEIESLPPADVVQVVRCKDCTFYVVNGCEDYCRKNQHFWDAEKDFCSLGKRREE